MDMQSSNTEQHSLYDQYPKLKSTAMNKTSRKTENITNKSRSAKYWDELEKLKRDFNNLHKIVVRELENQKKVIE